MFQSVKLKFGSDMSVTASCPLLSYVYHCHFAYTWHDCIKYNSTFVEVFVQYARMHLCVCMIFART